MNVPNHEKKPFREMTPDERSAIVEEWINGCAEVWNCGMDQYQNAAKDLLSAGSIYRTKPRQLIIQWEVIKPEYKWAAMDMDGRVYVFKERPIRDKYDHFSDGFGFADISALSIDKSGIDWRESLVQRPE